ncbi:MAG TPA: biotin-dependent carboxyltransferase family protein [Chthoniobacterales bacterium]|jgi:antagonist of KipI
MNVSVSSAGFLTTVQDLGRAGFRRFGVVVGGALDPHSLRVANILAGNDESAAGLEVTLGNLRLRFADNRVVAWCGGPFVVRIADNDFPAGHAGLIAANEELLIAAPESGSRAWLAISGGIELASVFGSRSTDLRGKFGGIDGRPLSDGEILPLGNISERTHRITDALHERKISEWSAPAPWIANKKGERFLRIIRGSDWPRFAPDAQSALLREQFIVQPDSDRMGARLTGTSLIRADSEELLSEAVAPGTLQVPPNGEPILLLGDCQTIGGYPKIAHVITVDLPIAAQLGPGDSVRFSEVTLVEAQQLLLEREENLARFRIGMQLRTS